MNFIWKQKTGRFRSGESLYLNRIHLGGYEWNSCKSQGNKDKSIDWTGQVTLPSLKNQTVYGATTEEVKTNMERLVIQWFKVTNQT